MAKKVFDRIQEFTSTAGTGPLVLTGATPGFRPYSAVLADADTFDYCWVDPVANMWEIGTGTYTTSTNRIARTSVNANSSGSTVALNMAGNAGTYVFLTLSASMILALINGGAVPDGTTITTNSNGQLVVAAQTIRSLPVLTSVLGTETLPCEDVNGNSKGMPVTQLVAYLLALAQSTHDLTAATPTLADEIDFYSVSTGTSSKMTFSALQTLLGTTSSVIIPGQVGSLAAGTPTSTTIPLTWTAPSTGTAPITYTAATAPHGSTSWTANAGTFTSTGGTLTGLTASTNYDIRVTATNAAGNTVTLLTTGITTASSTGTAPSVVGSLAAGTPTSTTIPVTYTAATGTATITYTGQTSPHNANTWTNNAGTFTSTGGTFTGLTANTNYDLRIVATNGSGTTNTTLTTGITTTASGGSFPAIVFTGTPTFDAVSPIWGTKSIKGGAGVGSVTLPIIANANGSNQASCGVKLWLKCGTTGGGGRYTGPFLSYTPASGSDIRVALQNGLISCSVGGSTYQGSVQANDGLRHFIYVRVDSNYGVTYSTIFVDGNGSSVTNGGATAIQAGNGTLVLDMTQLLSTDMIDNIEFTNDVAFGSTVPTAATVRTSSTVALFDFENSDGTGS